MKIPFIIIALLCTTALYCQKDIELFQNDARGRPLYLTADMPMEGSPYFKDNYIPGNVTMMGGAVYSNIKLKINLVEHLVQYLKADGSEMITELPVQKIMLEGGFQLESFSGALNNRNAVIYQVLDSGRIYLLKKIVASYRDDRPYNAASTTRIFEKKESLYYRAANGLPQKLEKGRAAMLELFNRHKEQVAAYIDGHQLSCKTEQDCRELFRYYNALFL